MVPRATWRQTIRLGSSRTRLSRTRHRLRSFWHCHVLDDGGTWRTDAEFEYLHLQHDTIRTFAQNVIFCFFILAKNEVTEITPTGVDQQRFSNIGTKGQLFSMDFAKKKTKFARLALLVEGRETHTTPTSRFAPKPVNVSVMQPKALTPVLEMGPVSSQVG